MYRDTLTIPPCLHAQEVVPQIDANRQWHGGGPPLSREKSRDVLEQPRNTC